MNEDITQYENGQIRRRESEGVCRRWYKNGKLRKESNYKDGKLEGVHRRWYKNGKLKEESNYRNDTLEESKWWYNSGRPWIKIAFQNGKYEGEYKIWNSDGQIRSSAFYRNGEEIIQNLTIENKLSILRAKRYLHNQCFSSITNTYIISDLSEFIIF